MNLYHTLSNELQIYSILFIDGQPDDLLGSIFNGVLNLDLLEL